MNCAKCGTEIADINAGCSVCGAVALPAEQATLPAVAGDTRPCPFCAETIKANAVKCRFCGSALSVGAALVGQFTNPVPAPLPVQQPGGNIVLNAPPVSGTGQQPSIVIQNVQASPVPAAMYQGVKSPGLAVLLSFLLPGLGQFYNGEVGKGFLFIILAIVNIPLTFIVIGIFSGLALWIYGMVDAHSSAVRINTTGR